MSEPVWHLLVGGHQVGPVSIDDVRSRVLDGSVDRATLTFGPGLSAWTPLGAVPGLASILGPAAVPPMPPPPPRRAHEIDFEVHGTEMQFVEVTLDPGEAVVAEAGSLMYMTSAIGMETVFGDGSGAAPGGGSKLMGALLGAGKRLLTGESLFMTVFTNRGAGRERVAFAAPYAGKILPMDLSKLGGELVCQKDSFLCAARGVQVGIAFQKRIGVGLFGGEGFIMQRLTGDGLTFVHAGGTVHAVDLAAGETLRVDTGCLVAMTPSVHYDIQLVGGVKTALFGGEGLFFATLAGPGRVWLQSLPLSRLADRIVSAASRTGRSEEGSVLDAAGIGRIFTGG
jgi:uncharacterized protein (TIGR00266 family)